MLREGGSLKKRDDKICQEFLYHHGLIQKNSLARALLNCQTFFAIKWLCIWFSN